MHVLHSRWAKEGDSIFDLRGRGGRRHQYLKPGARAGTAGAVRRASPGRRDAHRQRDPAGIRGTHGRALPSRPPRSIACWTGTAGARWFPVPGIPRPTSRRSPRLKKLRRAVRQEVARQAEQGRPLRLMFMDEARFGRWVRRGRCWAPRGVRPVVGTAGASTPTPTARCARRRRAGLADHAAMHSECFGCSRRRSPAPPRRARRHGLRRSRVAHRHRALVPDNICILTLPPYSPELNPAEQLWDLREDASPTTSSATSTTSTEGPQRGSGSNGGRPTLRTQSMTGFGWITSISLNATQY